jgi:diguanylate cyclase (GGDEF)-like protein
MTVDRTVTPIMGIEGVAPQGRGRVLVVEDDADQAEAIVEVLRMEGYGVTHVSRGAEALNECRREPPGLMILDVGLPDMDGFAVAETLAGDRHTAAIPVVIVSAAADLATRVRRAERLELDFVRKPYKLEEILARVEHGLGQAQLRRRLHRDARFDELTGLGNTRLLDERLQVETARLERYGTPLAIAVLDVDKLKRINDEHGHLAGSAALQAIGQALRSEIRDTDLAVRFGGDEFVVMLPHTGLGEARAFAERVLQSTRALRPGGVRVSVSIGVAAFDQSCDGSPRALLARADQAVFRAKDHGGDCVETALPPPRPGS